MSWHTDQLKYALGLGGLVSFYGLVSVIVFVAGQQFGINLTTTIVVVALVLLTLPIALVIGYLATRRKKKPELAAAAPEAAAAANGDAAAAQPAAKLNQPSGKYEELTQSADTAVNYLKSSNLAGAKGAEAIYSLPFFVFAGEPRSGKTSLVLSSGLNFQTLPNQRQSEQNLIRPTRAAEWRVTDEAVILDTAGRYLTEAEADADEWSALIETLKKYRGQRPIDGFVLAVNAGKLLAADDQEIEQQAKLLRARLDETMQRAKTKFPVYLVFTNADQIEGFRDSFSVSQREGKNLILGATFPLEKAENAHALFDSEFELIGRNFLKRRLLRLSAPFPPTRQLRIFNFPSHLTSAKRKLGQFVSILFRPNPFVENPLFRGFYLTASLPNQAAGNGAAGTIGTEYFTNRFFRDVLLRDKDLVTTFQANKQKQPVLGWLLLVTGAILLTALVGLAAVSLVANRNLLNEATANGQKVLEITEADKGRDVLTKNATEARNEVEATHDLRETLVKLDDYERGGAPVWMRLGLYSGSRVFRERLLPIYFAAVEQRYKKPALKNLEADLQKFAANPNQLSSANLTDEQEKDLGKHYDLLKTYLMLSGEYKDRAEPVFLADRLEEYWKKSSPTELENLSQEQLQFYAKQVDREEFPRIQPDKNLVDNVRKRLQAYPPVFRYYKRVTTEIDQKIDPVSVESVMAGRSAGVLEGAAKVPGSFTIEGFREMQKAILLAQTELSKDDWVMGAATAVTNVTASNADVSKLQQRYFGEYTDAWRKFVRGTTVAKIDSKDKAVGALKAFSSTESPMEILLREIARNTNLSAKPKAKDWYGYLMSFFASATATKTDGNTEIEKEFKPLFGFIGDETKPEAAPVSIYRADLRKLVEPLEAASDDKIKQISKDLAADKDTIGLRKAESAINTKVEAFTTSAAQEVAELVKKPLQNLRVFFGADAQNQLEKSWREQILAKAKEIEKGFPFEDAGEADLQKITVFLNPANGTLAKFYGDRLEKYFEEADGALKVKETSEVKFAPEFVAYLNNAFKLREALFGKGANANFEYEFKLSPVKDAILEVSIDSQKIDSTSAGSAKFKFPGSSGGETGAFMQFTGTAADASAAAPTTSAAPTTTAANTAANTSANTSAANVSQPAPANKQSAANSAATTAASETSLRFPGQWGLFKMIEAGSPQKSAGDYVLTYKIGGKAVAATVRPTGGDLFDRAIFKGLRAPDKMLK